MVGTGTASAGGGYGGSGGGKGPTTLAEGLIGPLHLDVQRGHKGADVLVSQSFAGTISKVRSGGSVTDLVTEPGGFTGGVAGGPFGTLLYLSNGEQGAFLKLRLPGGQTVDLADLGTYEATKNPDQVNTYGLQGASPECLAQLPPDVPGLAPYKGDVNPNPYELAVTPWGAYVADAGGNTILFVEWSGKIRTVSVLPPRPEVVTAEAAAGAGLPECAVGLTFNFEPVPTDVEFGPGGLYVSSLPGGPEDASLGARGGVFKVDPRNGRATLIGTGFLGATNLAVAPNGTVYVAELFGGKISKLVKGGPRTVLEVTEPAGLEWSNGRLYATTDVNTSGKVITFRP
ncbi:ScyD/ScyE family protein [Dermatobacter hominis]|uniref:ScyD/ScyE family protein n=1 Tax=Dermatobacter hominis TaxID=2884263 RepID=UPI001D116FE4|nr:ScyD/ScyE family protein [Dermatobacter hominis]UDY37151.1 ScyD/ScyE family protein [Dermatobacter hominis]